VYGERRLGLPKHVPWLPAAALAFLALMLSPSGWGQAVTATLLGTITDNTGAAIPGVNISPFTSGQVGIIMGDFSSNPLIGYSASLPWIRGETNIDIVNH
jgi:hypothetical protein